MNEHQYAIGDIVFSEFEYNGLTSFHPVKIIDFARDNLSGKNYRVRSQDGEEYTMFGDNLFDIQKLSQRINGFYFSEV